MTTQQWISGKYGGSFNWSEKRQTYIVRFQNESSLSYSIHRYGSRSKALKEALLYRHKRSDELGITKNNYRYVEDYIEVQLYGDHIAKIDINDIDILNKNIWYAKSAHNRFYMSHSERTDLKSETFHRLVYPEWDEIDHINRDGLDNRRCNLRDGKFNNTNVKNQSKRQDNTSGKTGVHFEKSSQCWRIQWPEDGKRKKKSFSAKKYGMEGAKEKAIQFRVELDQRFGISNGYDSDCEDLAVAFPETPTPEFISLATTNTSGVNGVRFDGKRWVASWSINGKRASKTFSVETYGNDRAKELAIAKRLEMKPERN